MSSGSVARAFDHKTTRASGVGAEPKSTMVVAGDVFDGAGDRFDRAIAAVTGTLFAEALVALGFADLS